MAGAPLRAFAPPPAAPGAPVRTNPFRGPPATITGTLFLSWGGHKKKRLCTDRVGSTALVDMTVDSAPVSRIRTSSLLLTVSRIIGTPSASVTGRSTWLCDLHASAATAGNV